METKLIEIENYMKNVVKNVSDEDLKHLSWNPALVQKIKELGPVISISCEWTSYIENFPFFDEQMDQKYDTIGYIKCFVEYYKDDPSKKDTLQPEWLQQFPQLIRRKLDEWNNLPENEALFIDTESPFYVFVMSNQSSPKVDWNNANIDKYKYTLGNWVEIYSGQWPDYNEDLYDRRKQNNISNRLLWCCISVDHSRSLF